MLLGIGGGVFASLSISGPFTDRLRRRGGDATLSAAMSPLSSRLFLHVAAAVAAGMLSSHALAQACTSPNADDDFILGSAQGMDDTVMNVESGLVWKRCMAGQTLSGGTCNGVAAVSDWKTFANDQALFPKAFAGQDAFGITVPLTQDLLTSGAWRLPYRSELLTLTTDCPYVAPGVPTINQTVFPNTFAGHTATATRNGIVRAYQVNFDNAGSSDIDLVTVSALRAVRGGQPFAELSPGMDKRGTTGSTVVMGTFTLASATGAGESWGGAILRGDGNPEFQINGAGPWMARGIVKSGDVLTVRMTAPGSAGSEHVAELELRSSEVTYAGGNADGAMALRRSTPTAKLTLMAEAARTTVGVPSLSDLAVWIVSALVVAMGLRRLRPRG
jgi:hypothetical protein